MKIQEVVIGLLCLCLCYFLYICFSLVFAFVFVFILVLCLFFILCLVHVLCLKYLINIMCCGCVNLFPFHLNCAKHRQ